MGKKQPNKAFQRTVAEKNAILYENQKRLNEELIRTQKQLIQSEKLAALTNFGASIAHEINNPLRIIKNHIQILSESIDKNNPHLSAIKDEVDRIARIVRSLMDFSRPGKEKMSLLDLSSILKQPIFLVSKEFSSRNIQIKTKVPKDLPKVLGSENPLKQVILNLLFNTRDAMPQGGEVTVSARELDHGIEIELSDTGCGISEENIPRIFDPFFTTKENGKGTGLGLWVCSEIIQKHGGTLQAKRKEKGTSFIITLPTTKAD